LQEKLEQLQLEYDEKCNELAELQLEYEETCNELADCKSDLKAAKFEIAEMQIVLESMPKVKTGERRPSIVPQTIETGGWQGTDAPRKDEGEELRRLFVWLATNVDIHEPVRFRVTSENLTIWGSDTKMGDIVQWRVGESDLRLSVPDQLASEVSNLLFATKMNPDRMSEATVKHIMDSWQFSTAEVPTEKTSRVTLLQHRQSQVTCMVATFPLPHTDQEIEGFRIGDFVEVRFEGEWFSGVLKRIDHDGEASVQCNSDPLGVLTTSSITTLRRPGDTFEPPLPPPPPESKQENPTPDVPEEPTEVPQLADTSSANNGQSPPKRKQAFSHSRAFSCPSNFLP
jgi:hypothetical protein